MRTNAVDVIALRCWDFAIGLFDILWKDRFDRQSAADETGIRSRALFDVKMSAEGLDNLSDFVFFLFVERWARCWVNDVEPRQVIVNDVEFFRNLWMIFRF